MRIPLKNRKKDSRKFKRDAMRTNTKNFVMTGRGGIRL